MFVNLEKFMKRLCVCHYFLLALSLSSPPHTNINYFHSMSTPTISLPFSKRWPISTIFLVFLMSKKMHTLFVPPSYRHPFNSRFICGNSWRAIVPHSSSLSYHLRSRHRTAFVASIIPLSSPFSYHFRSVKYFQPPVNQAIPKFPSFPSFPSFPRIPNFPRFPRIPAFPCFPCRPKSSILPRHPQPRSARRSEQHESLDRAVCDQQTSVNFPPLPAPSVATENRQGHCLTKISIIRLIRSFIFLFAETIVINLINCQ